MQRFAAIGFEAILTTIQLPNAGSMQIALVYRSPSVPQERLITLLKRMLTHVTLSTTPCVILGDFNEDIVHCQNSAIIRFMSSFSFQQIVQDPTTPHQLKGVKLDAAIESVAF